MRLLLSFERTHCKAVLKKLRKDEGQPLTARLREQWSVIERNGVLFDAVELERG